MEVAYEPPEDFVVDTLQPLVSFETMDSKELWLIQCPLNQFPEIDGKELKLKLDKDGILGGFEDSAGKEFELVSFASQEIGASVIVPSGTESKIAGKISRRVSIVRYPEPNELIETVNSKTQQKLVGALTNSSGKFSNPAQSSRHRSGQSTLKHSSSTRISKQKSIFSGFTETPKSSKRKHSDSFGGSAGKHQSSTTTVSGSSGKPKKKTKIQD